MPRKSSICEIGMPNSDGAIHHKVRVTCFVSIAEGTCGVVVVGTDSGGNTDDIGGGGMMMGVAETFDDDESGGSLQVAVCHERYAQWLSCPR